MSDPSNDSSLERLREHVIDQLTTGYARDYLSQEEFERRVGQATDARNHHDLRALLIDLPLAGSPNLPVPTEGNAPELRGDTGIGSVRGDYLVNRGPVEERSEAIAIFSGTDRKGIWDPPRHLEVVAIFGGSAIDLREARIPADGMTIEVVALFGGVDIVVPEGVNVVTSGIGIFGGFDNVNRQSESQRGAPTVKVRGAAIFGGVDVKVKPRK